MEKDEHLKNFFSESESDESDMYFGSELRDNMGGIEKAFNHILKMRKRYLKALEYMMKFRKKTKRWYTKRCHTKVCEA